MMATINRQQNLGARDMKMLSIAEAKNTLPSVVHETEDGEDVGITRYGRPVAVLVSHDRYQTLTAKPRGFRNALRGFLSEHTGRKAVGLRDGEVDSWRDRRPVSSGNLFE
jgi:prevent-host-death family protein